MTLFIAVILCSLRLPTDACQRVATHRRRKLGMRLLAREGRSCGRAGQRQSKYLLTLAISDVAPAAWQARVASVLLLLEEIAGEANSESTSSNVTRDNVQATISP